MSDRERIVRAHAARLAAEAAEREAVADALRKRSVSEADIGRIIEDSTETVRQLRMAAGIPPDERKAPRQEAPELIYAFRDEAGTWWPKGHDRLLGTGYVVGLVLRIKEGLPSRFAGQRLEVMCASEPDALPDDSPGYVYTLSDGRERRTTKAVHDEIWRIEAAPYRRALLRVALKSVTAHKIASCQGRFRGFGGYSKARDELTNTPIPLRFISVRRS